MEAGNKKQKQFCHHLLTTITISRPVLTAALNLVTKGIVLSVIILSRAILCGLSMGLSCEDPAIKYGINPNLRIKINYYIWMRYQWSLDTPCWIEIISKYLAHFLIGKTCCYWEQQQANENMWDCESIVWISACWHYVPAHWSAHWSAHLPGWESRVTHK